jgi:hypothetical protein
MKKIALILAFLTISTAQAAVIDIEYQYDGTTFKALNGLELFGTVLNVGDTLNLTYVAKGSKSYWDFSTIFSTGNVNLGFTYPASCGSRSTSGSYSAWLDGTNLLSNNYNNVGQSCIHAGPENIDFSSVTKLDMFKVSYQLNASSAPSIVGSYSNSTWWQVWELFQPSNTGFVYVQDQAATVAAPANLALFGLGLTLMSLFRTRKAQK